MILRQQSSHSHTKTTHQSSEHSSQHKHEFFQTECSPSGQNNSHSKSPVNVLNRRGGGKKTLEVHPQRVTEQKMEVKIRKEGRARFLEQVYVKGISNKR